MSLNIIDVVIILMILMLGILGFKRGLFKQIVMTVGTIIVFILAYTLKDYLGDWLCINMPFFNFGGIFQGLPLANIILYQLIAFLIVLSILLAILSILINVTNILEKLLKFTIVLGIPSKILGFIVGLIEGYIIVFVILFFISQPAINWNIVNESKYKDKILDSTPALSSIVKKTNNTITDLYRLAKNYNNADDKNDANLEVLDTMLKYKIVDKKLIVKLKDKGKLSVIGNIDEVLNNY